MFTKDGFVNSNNNKEAAYNENLKDSITVDLDQYGYKCNNRFGWVPYKSEGETNLLGLVNSYWEKNNNWGESNNFKYENKPLPLVKKTYGMLPQEHNSNWTCPFIVKDNCWFAGGDVNTKFYVEYFGDPDSCYAWKASEGADKKVKICDGPGIFFLMIGGGGGGASGRDPLLGSSHGGSGGGSGGYILGFIDLKKAKEGKVESIHFNVGVKGTSPTKEHAAGTAGTGTYLNYSYEQGSSSALVAGGGTGGTSSAGAAGGTGGEAKIWNTSAEVLKYIKILDLKNGCNGGQEGKGIGESYAETEYQFNNIFKSKYLPTLANATASHRGFGGYAYWPSAATGHGGGGGASVVSYWYTDKQQTSNGLQGFGFGGYGGHGGGPSGSTWGSGTDGGQGVVYLLDLA